MTKKRKKEKVVSEPPKPPLGRVMKEGTMGTCPICRSTEKRKFALFGFGDILGCINPECPNYYKNKS